jgi:hypothetical protein
MFSTRGVGGRDEEFEVATGGAVRPPRPVSECDLLDMKRPERAEDRGYRLSASASLVCEVHC